MFLSLAMLYVSLTRAIRNKRCAGARLFLICMGMVLYSFIAISASATDFYPRKIHFRNIMQNEDFALGEVEAILQDHQGFMWLGGRNGLLRYDGYEFLSIPISNNPDDPTKVFTVNQVLELLEDSRQNIWVATRSSLYKYDRAREILLPLHDANGSQLFREAIYALAETSQGELLVGSGTGIFTFNPETYEQTLLSHIVNNPKSLPSNLIHDLLVAPDDIVWVGLNEGLLRIDWKSQEQTLFIPDPVNAASVANNGVRTIALDKENRVWIGTDNGIHRFDPERGNFTTYRHNPDEPYS